MIVLSDPTLRSSARDPRLARVKTQAEIIKNSYNISGASSNALATQPVDPIALAQILVHKPAMERINRCRQLEQRQLKTPDPNNTQGYISPNMSGMFCKSRPNRKPKGSRNIPLSLPEETAIPASCWPLLQAQEANLNMWTASSNTAQQGPPANSIEALMELIDPVSPLSESPNIGSSPQSSSDPNSSLETQPSEDKHSQPLTQSLLDTPSKSLDNQALKAPSAQNQALLDIAPANFDYNNYGSAVLSPVSSLASTKMSEHDMYLDATFVAGDKRSGDSQDEPKAKKTAIQALAKAYKAKVDQTKASLVLKQGGGPVDPQPSLEGTVRTEYINEVVKVDPTPIAKPSYAEAPLVTLRDLLPEGVIEDAPQDLEGAQLDQVFRAESIEFVIMIKPLPKEGTPIVEEWDFPDPKQFDSIMNEAFADFIDQDITRMDIIKWSSVGTKTGIGAFMANTNKLDLVQLFRSTIRQKVYNGNRAESFPKQTMLSDFGITLYAHGGTIAYRPAVLLAMLLRTYQSDFAGECEVLKADIFPANHPLAKRQNARIIALLPDQTFLDHLQKFPANFAFSAGFCKRLYIRGGSRIDPKAPEAKKPTRRPKFGRAAITKLLLDNQKEILEKGEAEQDVAERMGQASI